MGTILILVVVVGFGAYYIGEHPEILGNIGITMPFSISGNNNGSGGNVTRKLQFAFTDKFSGSALTSKTFYIYSPAGALLETLTTDGDGIKATARAYTTGDVIFVKYVSGNSKIWYQVTVPAMSSNDAFSQTYNPIALEAFSVGTYTGTLRAQGTAYATNYADGNGSTPTFTYEIINTGADDTGMMNSLISDPIYGQAWQAELVVTLSGTGYETCILNGFDQTFTLGTTLYGVKALDVNQLTKWKVGNTYQYGYQGDQVQSFSVDLTGYVAANSTTMNVYVKAYADPNYAMSHGGSFGASVYQLATGSCVFYHYG